MYDIITLPYGTKYDRIVLLKLVGMMDIGWQGLPTFHHLILQMILGTHPKLTIHLHQVWNGRQTLKFEVFFLALFCIIVENYCGSFSMTYHFWNNSNKILSLDEDLLTSMKWKLDGGNQPFENCHFLKYMFNTLGVW